MKCPKCNKEMGAVWVSKSNARGVIQELGDVEYCWKCGNLFLARPELIEIQG